MRLTVLSRILLLLAAFAFWAFVSPYHLLYLEQNRIFEMTVPFLLERLKYPGGLSCYLGSFVCQFFTNRFAAGSLTSVLLVLLQVAVCRAVWKMADNKWYLMTFVPSFLFWAFFCKAGNLPDSLIALILALLAFDLTGKAGTAVRIFLCVILYYLLGSVSLIYAVLLSAELAFNRQYASAVSIICLAAALPLLFSLVVQMPLSRLYKGIDVNLLPGKADINLMAGALSVPVIFVCARWSGAGKILAPVLSIAAIIITMADIMKSVEAKRESAFAYDYMASHCQWNEIINRALRNNPKSPLEVTCLNLALVQTGQSGDRMFHFYQNGVSGLFPPFDGNYLQMVSASDALYHSGLLNMALRYTFEAYTSSPDFNESPRFLRRMAEINILNGRTEVAEKYLRKLSHTATYGRMARSLSGHPASLLAETKYACLQACCSDSVFLFNDDGKDAMLRLAVKSSEGKNASTVQYLIAFDLLSRNLPAFASDLDLVLPYVAKVPVHWQEAALLAKKVFPDKSGVLDRIVDAGVREHFENYRRDVLSGMISNSVRKKYGDTYWYYFLNEQ